MMRNNFFSTLLLFLIFAGILSGCGNMKKKSMPNIIKEIAYDVDKKHGYTVYIEEDSIYKPYLVLTDDYNGNVLLLRKYILDESRIFNENFRYSGYYKDSSIDSFLNEEFINDFNTNLQDEIISSQIEITDRFSLGSAGIDTINIRRKIFLLSHTEMGLSKYSVVAIEGKELKYFSDPESRIAYTEAGETSGWWLRTSYTIYDTTAWSIGYDATVGGVGVYYENGIRPSFCIRGNTNIEKRDDIVGGESIYVFK